MDNIRLSLNPLKLSGTRIVNANNAAGKVQTYVAIPIEHFFVPQNDPKPYLMCSMIPCPNAQYGDFMVKPFVSGTDWEQMSDIQRRDMPIIGKGTFMRQAVPKAIKHDAEQMQVTDITPTQLTPTDLNGAPGGSAAPLNSAPSLPEGQQVQQEVPVTRFDVACSNGQRFWFPSWNDAAIFASQDNANRRLIYYVENGADKSAWRWDEAKITWIQNF